MENQNLFEVVITAIIVKDKKFLITRRALTKKRFPGMWTVPGGKLETKDFIDLPKETKDYWYNVLEKALKREVAEEVGIQIKNIAYITSLATIHLDNQASLVISCLADFESGEVKLQIDETDDYKWVNLEEAKSYQLIDGIYDELAMANNQLKGTKSEWQRF